MIIVIELEDKSSSKEMTKTANEISEVGRFILVNFLFDFFMQENSVMDFYVYVEQEEEWSQIEPRVHYYEKQGNLQQYSS